MWKTLYAIGLAVPRILLRPSKGFQVIIPASGAPVIRQPREQSDVLNESVESAGQIDTIDSTMSGVSVQTADVVSQLKELIALITKDSRGRSDILIEIIQNAEKYKIDLLDFIKLQEFEKALRNRIESHGTA